MSAETTPDVTYLRARYPDPARRAAMARDADDIAARAVALGNTANSWQWGALARRLRDSLKGA